MFDLEDLEIIDHHDFSDASLKAQASVIYVRFKLKDGSYCTNFVARKTKINHIERKKLNDSKIRINGKCTFESTHVFSLNVIKI